ncbi:SGNH/GDSL hydrolase family protein [Massilia sp. HP4]|uniref:SGNH/GDSL hydrolase family protein n=1 Tax=Massilia sp. HP4 TaxID=2562316 RepID=UPI0010C0FAEB|nr:SGNH/GDSL hydrolase family protein [Massilia sp. HP4]
MALASHPLVTPLDARFIHGAVEIEQTRAGLLPHRLPAWARARSRDPRLALAAAQGAGVRLAFQTASRWLDLVVRAPWPAVGPDGVYDLLVDGRLARQASVRSARPLKSDVVSGMSTPVGAQMQVLRFGDLSGARKTVEIWLPHDQAIELVALRSPAPVAPLIMSKKRRWLHHGGAISQGANAAHPTGTWPAVAALRGGVDLLNLGLSGNALLDPFLARTIRAQDADLISLKIGIDLVNTDLMRLRAFGPAVHGFLDTIRDGHPATPLFVVSPLCSPIHEDVPGPTKFETDALAAGRVLYRAAGDVNEIAQGKLTLGVIRQELEAIVRERAAVDPDLHYLDGRRLFGLADSARLALRDELHLDDASHRRIGERFAELVLIPSHATVAHRELAPDWTSAGYAHDSLQLR